MKKFFDYYQFVKQTAQLDAYNGILRQLCDMAWVFLRCRVGPGYFLMAQMGLRQYDWRYKLGFMNGRQYLKRINHINNLSYYPATFNKLIEKALFTQYALATPQCYGHINPDNGRSCDGYSLTNASDLGALIQRQQMQQLCFKLVSEFGGLGFRAAEVLLADALESGEGDSGDGIKLRDLGDGQLYSLEGFYHSLDFVRNGGFVVEQYFRQHEALAAINPTSVNTLRMMVYQREGESTHCFGAFLRVGRIGKLVDNGMAGGILAKVDINTGVACAGTSAATRCCSYPRHPDSNAEIEGFQLPYFDQAKALACDALDVIPEICYAGVDIAIGPNGPCVIELNAMADYVDFAILNEPSKYALS